MNDGAKRTEPASSRQPLDDFPYALTVELIWGDFLTSALGAHATVLHTLRDSFGMKHNSNVCKEGSTRYFERFCGESSRFWKDITSGRAALRVREGRTPRADSTLSEA
ncbi:hypothetical protein PENSPDRAFT_686285 [Peniophora sp. CONT]|nr:hypothetical protein PENSPDRAFT_686285 [Peniophora sp. CONT]